MPAQILRGLLLSIAFFPFYSTLLNWNYGKRFAAISGVYILVGF